MPNRCDRYIRKVSRCRCWDEQTKSGDPTCSEIVWRLIKKVLRAEDKPPKTKDVPAQPKKSNKNLQVAMEENERKENGRDPSSPGKYRRANMTAPHTEVDVCALEKGQEEHPSEERGSPWQEEIDSGRANIDGTPALLPAAKSNAVLESKADLERHDQTQDTKTVDSSPTIHASAETNGAVMSTDTTDNLSILPEMRVSPWQEEIDFGKANIDATPALLPAAKSNAALESKADFDGHARAQVTETVDSPIIHATAETNAAVKSTDTTENIPILPDNVDHSEARAKSIKIFSFVRILKILFAVPIFGSGSLYVHDLLRFQAIKRERRQRFMIHQR